MKTASSVVSLESHAAPRVLVHYCEECHAHVSAVRTRHLAAAVASTALALGVAAWLLLSWGSYAVPLQMLAALGAAALPLGALLGRAPRPGHAAHGSAVWWESSRTSATSEASQPAVRLVAASDRWARLVAREHDLPLQEARRARPPLPGWLALPLVLAALLPPLAVHALGCHVRVVNRTAEPARLLVDGRLLGTVAPTSAESPLAGFALDVVAGERRLTLISRTGRVLADVTAGLRPGVDHLFAVSDTPVCFWLERSSYGRAATSHDGAAPKRETLLGQGPLWALPHPVDSWFAPNPGPANSDTLSSGGERVALRQGRCAVGTTKPAIILPLP